MTTVIATAVLTVVMPGPARAREHDPQFPAATAAALTSIVTKGMAASNTPGMAVGIWVPGKGTYVRAFGTDDISTGAPFRLGDHMRIASITKTFTATAILQLVDRKRLSLGSHLSAFVKASPTETGSRSKNSCT